MVNDDVEDIDTAWNQALKELSDDDEAADQKDQISLGKLN
jgi:hypothetical protein